jgi:hypothetical protein
MALGRVLKNEKKTASYWKKLYEAKVKSLTTTVTEEKPQSAMGNFVDIYSNENEKGFWSLKISYAPFEHKKGGMISVMQWKGKYLQKCSFSTDKCFGSNVDFFGALKKVAFSKYVKE